jgi:AraC-like DNA-binding protein
MAPAKKQRHVSGIEQMSYQPPAPYQLDLEIFSVSDLKQRVGKAHLRHAHQIMFHMLILITRGECTHLIDFHPVHCQPGTVLVLRPAQAQKFDLERDWDGWIVLFRPEFLLSPQATGPFFDLRLAGSLEELPDRLSLQEHERRTLTGAIAQMYEDAGIDAQSDELHALLRHQLYALLMRLFIMHGKPEAQGKATSLSLQRFKRFQQLVEKHFAQWHQVVEYAERMGCSEKSLTRATLEVASIKPKAYVASRINLEAKRLLAHTALSITLVSDRLGFDDMTNFVKFFKREVGCTPGEFRRRQEEAHA